LATFYSRVVERLGKRREAGSVLLVSTGKSCPLCGNFLHDLFVHIGEAEVSSSEAVGGLFAVEAGFGALAVDKTALEAGAGHPHREGLDVVVRLTVLRFPPIGLWPNSPLGSRGCRPASRDP